MTDLGSVQVVELREREKDEAEKKMREKTKYELLGSLVVNLLQ